MPFSLTLVHSIDSTNTFLMNKAAEHVPLLDEKGTLTDGGKKFNLQVMAAETQTKGRGRLGRTFESPDHSGIYFSFAFVPEGGISDPALITVSACVGVCRAIEKTYGIKSRIKWVNDIYCNGKKVCGILTEGIVNPAAGRIDGCVCGIGINIRTGDTFDSQLKNKAGGILDGIDPSTKMAGRREFLQCCLDEIHEILIGGQNIIQEYKDRSLLSGMTVTVTPVIGDDTTSYKGTVTEITDDFGLKVILEDGSEKTLHSGEVSLHDTDLGDLK
ncbi:MAG: biotin--[acetyl-CoA-carboxylase] ligase [Treponema sp.]|nr:biotin--[acetyl-CoA-carboxylase] ligase [Candidatus Treponema equi]